ncbi:putative disease resistance protein At4g19050 [Prosopis cineraria]|uniref:putative disease resistance protein At4g19050 n=1 Tax=Prosopis cineraria TaxID=364024 RepID=UPI00240EE8D9|nr:putative disease resistance protein At4g19050 [Prosopis cineraria]
MKFVFGENGGVEQAVYNQIETQIVLPLLEYLTLQRLPNLVGICSENYHLRFPSMKKIDQKNCPNMELTGHQLRNEKEYKPLAAIQKIERRNYGLESIFHYQTRVEEQIPTFQYLKKLTLQKCSRLKFFFFAHLCPSLPELTSVTIFDFEELESIFSRNEGIENNLSTTETYLPKLEKLEIKKCNKLKFILSFTINNAATTILPQLRALTISDSFQLEEIFRCSSIEDHDIDREREIVFPNLNYITLDKLPRLVNSYHGFKLHPGFCSVYVRKCLKFMPMISAAIDWTEEGLVRKYVLKTSQLNRNEALNLSPTILNVGEVDIQSSRVDHEFQVMGDDNQEETMGLECLRSEQQMLGGHVPTQVLSFQYLHSLEMIQCKKSKFLFSMSTIVDNSLPKLSSLTLSDCEDLEVIFGYVAVPQASTKNSDLQTIADVEKQLYQNEEKGIVLMISREERLSLRDSGNFLCVWEGPTLISFQNLSELHVNGSKKLKCIFPSTVIKSLPCLWHLYIDECEELEEIMSSEPHFPNASSSSFCFPLLHWLYAIKCRKLKWLFPSLPSTQHLRQLETLIIKECFQVERLFNCEVEIQEEGFYKNQLSKLQFLEVADCPMFSETTLAALQSTASKHYYKKYAY